MTIDAPRLLIVEDEAMVAWDIAEMSRELGYEIDRIAKTEGEALEAVHSLSPDIILMDYRLGVGGNGLAVARHIRETKNIPIIFCTAYMRGSLPAELLALPKMRLIGKPIRMGALREALAWAAAELNCTT